MVTCSYPEVDLIPPGVPTTPPGSVGALVSGVEAKVISLAKFVNNSN